MLVLGGSGFVGSALARALPQIGVPCFDLGRERLRDRVSFRAGGFSHAVLAHGITTLAQCAGSPEKSTAVNVDGMIGTIDDLVDAGIHPIFLSSDAVFDGASGFRGEDDRPAPLLTYGRQKLAVEDYLKKLQASWTILRLTQIIAPVRHPRNLLSQWLDAIERGLVIQCATDQKLTPIFRGDVVRAVRFVLETDSTGIFHVAGDELMTRYELLQCLVAKLPATLRRRARIEATGLRAIPFPELLPLDCSLSNEKWRRASGIMLQTADEVCAQMSGALDGAGTECIEAAD